MKVVLAVLIILMAGFGATQAQQTSITLNCSGTNDTAEFNRVASIIGSISGTLKIPAQANIRCAISETTIPANITLDNAEGSGITLKTGGTLTILGSIINP